MCVFIELIYRGAGAVKTPGYKDGTLGLIGVSMLDPLELYPFKLFAHWTFLEALKESVSNKRK